MILRPPLVFAALTLSGVTVAAQAPPQAIVASARASVEAALGSRYSAMDLVETTRPVAAAPEDVTLRAMPVVGRFPRQRFTVDVQFVRRGRVVGKATVGFALHVAGEGWVYTRDAHDHDDVASLAIERGAVDVARAAPASPDDLIGMRLRRNVRAGQPVSLSDFERVPDVDNRQTVRLRAAFGEIMVESAGLALRAGNRGDVVTVQVEGATAPVKATVVERGVAELVQ
jgi:flagella basal body P-ring formation protein FlgA